MSFAILTDTSANLPTPYLRAHGVEVLPFHYFVDGDDRTCMDTEAFDGAAYYDAMRKGTRVTTSQICPNAYAEAMEPALAAGQDLIYISMSSGISGSYASSVSAAAELREQYPERTIYTLDTLGASLGEGILVMKAVECRDAGMTLDETYTLLEAMRHRMYQVFIVDDLMHLRRTGRLFAAIALVGTVLQVKPLLKGNEKGQIVNFARFRGRKKALDALAEKYDTLVRNAENQVVGIAHADCEADAQYLAEKLRAAHPAKEILIVCYEPVTGSHVGPGTLALFFEGDEDVRSK